MAHALIGMGSNIEQEKHLSWAADALRKAFDRVRFSSVYQSKAVGMQGDDFLNACCLVHGDFTLQALVAWCKAQEDAQGRDRAQGSWQPRTIDLDVLMFDGRVVDEEVYQYAHAYVPAQELVDLDALAIDASLVTPVNMRL